MKRVGTTLFLTSENLSLEIQEECLVIRKAGERVRDIPLLGLENITMLCWDGWLTAETIRRCAEHKISVNIGTPYGKFQARVEGAPTGNILLRRELYRVADDPERCLGISKSIVRAKIHNQSHCLKKKLKTDFPEMDNVKKRSEQASSTAELLGIEGEAASIYFGNWGSLITNPEFDWSARSRRPPLDPPNALLSFLYTLASNDCKSACLNAGLDAYCGIYHRDQPGRASLALDLVEEFRVKFADQCVLFLLNNRMLSQSDFKIEKLPSGQSIECTLTEVSIKTVLKTYQERKMEEVYHPQIEEKIPWGWAPTVQARLLAKAIRENVEYIPMLMP